MFEQGHKLVAMYTEVPRVLRRLWAKQVRGLFSDIFQVEAVGPLLLAHNYGERLRGRYWLHFIDNSSAQYSIIKGSSSVDSGDIIVGATWSLIAELQSWLWIDRVASKSNPIDGVSRLDFTGPWAGVGRAHFPLGFLEEVARTMAGGP